MHKNRLILIICGLILSGMVLYAQAATLPQGFNMATVPVASQSTADLHPALVKAFTQVLIKISGNSQITTLPGIQPQLANADRFAQKYRYIGSNLQVVFDDHALITLLAQAQQPVWLLRPTVLIWLSVSGHPPLVSGVNPPDPALTYLQNDTDARGLPVIFPKMDANDQADWQAKTSDKPLDQAALAKIVGRYQVPAILYGELTQAADQSWGVDWFWVWGDQTLQWHSSGAEPDVLQAGIDKIADLMGSRLAVSLNQQDANNLWLAVLDIHNLADYSSMLAVIKQSSPVLGVDVKDVGSNGVLLQVTTTGEGEAALQAALANNPHFVPVPADPKAQPADNVLRYQWKS